MKKICVLFLILLLFCGCAADPVNSEVASIPETAPATAEAVPLAGLSDLTEGFVLFYAEADFEARQGTLLPLETVQTAPEEALLPRTHIYDELFPEEAALWLRLMDYASAKGYQGFSVPEGTLPELTTDQRRALKLVYRVDYGQINTRNKDGATSVWYKFYDKRFNDDSSTELFTKALAEARRVAAQAPRGDAWETVYWIFCYLGDHVSYGDRDTYYMYHGHHLYDALVEGSCVCSGFADAMYYLCSLCGIECLVVEGLADSDAIPGGLDGHAWIYARIDGLWYAFDPTGFAVSPRTLTPVFFGCSSFVLNAIAGNRLTGDYTNEALIPRCERCFDPTEVWSKTPEGALRSWLWYAFLANAAPDNLMLVSGLADETTRFTPLEEGAGVSDIPFETFRAWTLRFMSEDCAAQFFPAVFFETEDGCLGVRRSEDAGGIDWMNATLCGVAAGADGVYTAELGVASAVFTVSQTPEGRYRIETIALTPNE